jgi:hypothetical protein
MPPVDAGKMRPGLGSGAFDCWRGEMRRWPGGCAEVFLKEMAVVEPGIGQTIGNIIRQVVQDIIGVLTPVIDAIGVGMVLLGLLIGLGLRQEFLGFRLIIGGALALLTTHIIIPTILALT